MAVSIFKRLNETVSYPSKCFPHLEILEHFAYDQLTIKGNYASGPSISIDKRREYDTDYFADKYQYRNIIKRLNSSIDCFMKPYKLVVFGNDETNTIKSHLLTRVWLDHADGHNKVLALIENINADHNDNYIKSLKYTTTWEPNLSKAFDAKYIKQTIIKTDEPYKGSYNCIMEMQ